jgi:hypothetical protein
MNTASDLGANGILGVGVAPWDCGTACATDASVNVYYACPGGANCSATTVAPNAQVANPVAHFPSDNNGVIVEMEPLPYAGAATATGTLVFGIGTRANNQLSAAQRFQTTASGDVGATFNGRTLNAFLDSGSNALYFSDSALPQCGGRLGTLYCPSSPVALSAALTGLDASTGSASFAVVSAASLLANANYYAFNDIAGQFGSSANLDLGLPFFYGRYVYFGLDTTALGGTQSPYIAF